MSIKLTDAAQYFNKEPHQLVAWNWLESGVSTEVLGNLPANTALKPLQNLHSLLQGTMYK